ncbi:MAG: hypothetical protein ACK4GL_00690 [Flavobacteriales bacterium]
MLKLKSAQKGVLAILFLLIYVFATWVSFEAQEKKVEKVFVATTSTIDTDYDVNDFYAIALFDRHFQKGTEKNNNSQKFEQSSMPDLLSLEWVKFTINSALLPDVRLIIVALSKTDIIFPFHSFL